MRFLAAVLFALTLSSLSLAQIPRIEVFGGFSAEHIAPCGTATTSAINVSCAFESGELLSSRHFYNGWNAAVTVGGHFVGLTADVAGHYGSFNSAPSLSRHSFLFGPTVRFPLPVITPFAHALFGVVKQSSSSDPALAFTAPEFALGGGVDWKLMKFVAVRVAQVDYEWQRNPTSGLSAAQGFRVGAGVVLKF